MRKNPWTKLKCIKVFFTRVMSNIAAMLKLVLTADMAALPGSFIVEKKKLQKEKSAAFSIFLLKKLCWGLRYYCPFCNGTYRVFFYAGSKAPVFKEKQIVGGGYIKSTCPGCFSDHRERLIISYLKRTRIFTDKVRVLHIAPETGIRKILSGCGNIEYVCGDKFAAKYTLESYDAGILYMDITGIAIPDESFDIIICNHVLEHIPNDAAAMGELFRVLKYGGWAILQVPVSLTLETTYEDPGKKSAAARLLAYGQFDHVRIYAKGDYIRRLERTGFIVQLVNPAAYFGQDKVDKLCLDKNEDIFLCKKESGRLNSRQYPVSGIRYPLSRG